MRPPEPRLSADACPVAPYGAWPAQFWVTAASGVALIQCGRLSGLAGGLLAWAGVSVLYLAATWRIGMALRHRSPQRRLGAGNAVTFLRMSLVASLLPPLTAGAAGGMIIAATGLVALALDGADGWLARRGGLASDFGARFDVEVDAGFALILALHAMGATGLIWPLLVLGGARYAFSLAALRRDWLRHALPPRMRRKAICVLQLSALLILQLPGLPPAAATMLAWVAALALIWSFAIDVLWLRRRR